MSLFLLLLLLCPLVSFGGEPIMLAPQAGDNAPALLQALARLRQAAGGTLVLGPGVYGVGAELKLDGLTNVQIVGKGETVLRLLPERHTRTTKAARAGDRELFVRDPAVLAPGLALELQGAVRMAETPDGKPHRIPYLNATIKEVREDRLVLTAPLSADVSADSAVLHPMNLFDGRRGIRSLTIRNLTLDLNRAEWPVAPINHSRHSAVFFHGPYSYEKGPTGDPIEGVRIVECAIRNCHHRGVAFYNVRHGLVYRCRIEDTAAEGIDFDHFATHCQAIGNTLVNCRNLELNDASDCLVADNALRDCPGGIVVWQWCKLPGLNERNAILRNVFEECKAPAIALREGAEGNLVQGNSGHFATGPALVVEGKGNWVGENPFQIDVQGPVLKAGDGCVLP